MFLTKIFGAPGTGKTTAMLNYLQKEIEDGVPLKKIAFVTHTVAARQEVTDRLSKILKFGPDDIRYFRTIHAICFRELGLSRQQVMSPVDFREFGEYWQIPFSTNYTSDVDEYGIPIGYAYSTGNQFMQLRQYVKATKTQYQDNYHLWPQDQISTDRARKIVQGYDDWMREQNKYDFVEMLSAYEKSGEPLDIDVMFIDEAQDLSRQQWDVVGKMMERAKRVYLAGDDDQSIYAFLGADRYGFLDFKADSTEILPVTHRLPKNIWEFASSKIVRVRKRMPKDVKPKKGDGVLETTGEEISHLEIDYSGSVLFIARHNKQLGQFRTILERDGIANYGYGTSLTGTKRAVAIHSYFTLKEKGAVKLKDAAHILFYIGQRKESKDMKRESAEHPDLFITKEEMEKKYDLKWPKDWVRYLGQDGRETSWTVNEKLRWVMNRNGLDSIIEEPRVGLTTYHGSKGREADEVILLTDCYTSAYDSAQMDRDDEIRLSYVGITRAKKKLTILTPRTNIWMETLYPKIAG